MIEDRKTAGSDTTIWVNFRQELHFARHARVYLQFCTVNSCQDFPNRSEDSLFVVIIHRLNEIPLKPAQWTIAHFSVLPRRRRRLFAFSYLFSAPELRESVTQQKPNFGGTRIPVRLHLKQVDRTAAPGLVPDFGLSYPRNAKNHASPASTIPSP